MRADGTLVARMPYGDAAELRDAQQAMSTVARELPGRDEAGAIEFHGRGGLMLRFERQATGKQHVGASDGQPDAR